MTESEAEKEIKEMTKLLKMMVRFFVNPIRKRPLSTTEMMYVYNIQQLEELVIALNAYLNRKQI